MKFRYVILGVIIMLSVFGFIMLDDDSIGFQEELNEGTNPFQSDTDMDGLTDSEEKKYNTSPVKPDTDGDGLEDGVEITQYNTSPTDSDTDNDNLSDGREVEIGTDPTQADTDNDGLNDSIEVNEYNTSPTDSDTDDDNLSDGVEITQYNTSPIDSDTDNDNLSDGREVEIGTNPTKKDTDNDGLHDGTEVNNKYEEADPLRKDIYLEVDTNVDDNNKINSALQTIKSRYSNAPVENPDGSKGISVHYTVNSELTSNTNEIDTDYYKNTLYTQEFDKNGEGYNHIVITDTQICHKDIDCDRVTGFSVYSDGGINGAVIDGTQKNSASVSNTLLHEMGHLFGISPETYQGVDSESVSFSQYPSVMNYNTDREHTRYSEGKGFNDWNVIKNNLNTTNTSKLYNHSQ